MLDLTLTRWSLYVRGFGFGPLASTPHEARLMAELAVSRAVLVADDPHERRPVGDQLARAALVQVLVDDPALLPELEQHLTLDGGGGR